MRLCALLPAALALAGLACRSPLADLKLEHGAPSLNLAVRLEDHSRKLARIKDPEGEADTPAARRAALESQRAAFEAELRAEAASRGLRLDPAADLRLDLTITSLGEVRAKYIAWGILSGVGWGVGVGLLAHDPRLAVGLGLYELLEESAFWIGGSILVGRWSSPAVVEARLVRANMEKPLWQETYYVLWARRELAALPPTEQSRRERQLQASLRKVMGKLFRDLEAIPEFPRTAALPRPLPEGPAGAPSL
ncbi:hypothetical protein [Geothrix edaphica]|uniref:Uncharacterized protein n=1 Tax=Geothrix edaphica TaxID=2927976 RepID=A0ABQ5PY99_9BACT|nr:hypothetical protein [Geothrix edaphica]GLH67435.1 hypothetical protein GETHED_17990 [Geothrix edaphica]